ncbi:MAG: hypothetical protein M1814_003846 [Vezdaea aestivalis]|nr:MAG: hypothetical protein M1814_003846 [Vezdaea aestivalis]
MDPSADGSTSKSSQAAIPSVPPSVPSTPSIPHVVPGPLATPFPFAPVATTSSVATAYSFGAPLPSNSSFNLGLSGSQSNNPQASPFGPIGPPPVAMSQVATVSYAMPAYRYSEPASYYDPRSAAPSGYGAPQAQQPYTAYPPPNSRESQSRSSLEGYPYEYDYYSATDMEPAGPKGRGKVSGQRRPSNRDEFDGDVQFIPKPPQDRIDAQAMELPHLPVSLPVEVQDEVLSRVNELLSNCAFDFVAKYQFPVPVESDKRQVRIPADREWTEWVYLLKRLATKRRIPARVLYNGQIKQLVTVLENSLEMRHAAKHQSRPSKDDRNVLQLISAGIQVARMLKDAIVMGELDRLYVKTEHQIHDSRTRYSGYPTRYPA